MNCTLRFRLSCSDEAMFEGLDLPALGYRVMKSTATDLATHVVLGRQ